MRYKVVLLVAVVVLAGSLTARASVISGPLGSSGWQVDGNAAGSLGVTVDGEGVDIYGKRFVAIQVFKVFADPPDPQTNLLQSINLTFTQTAADNAMATRIYIADETITNWTGVAWWDFHWVLGTTDVARFNRELTNPTVTPNPNEPGWSIAPFTTYAWSEGLNMETLSVAGGQVPHQTTCAIGLGSGNLIIDVDLGGQIPAIFTLKELPTIPEPASLMLIGCGGMALLWRRRAPKA
jgi:hypothetical protein